MIEIFFFSFRSISFLKLKKKKFFAFVELITFSNITHTAGPRSVARLMVGRRMRNGKRKRSNYCGYFFFLFSYFFLFIITITGTTRYEERTNERTQVSGTRLICSNEIFFFCEVPKQIFLLFFFCASAIFSNHHHLPNVDQK